MIAAIIERDIRCFHLREDVSLVARVRAIKQSDRYFSGEGFSVSRITKGVGWGGRG